MNTNEKLLLIRSVVERVGKEGPDGIPGNLNLRNWVMSMNPYTSKPCIACAIGFFCAETEAALVGLTLEATIRYPGSPREHIKNYRPVLVKNSHDPSRDPAHDIAFALSIREQDVWDLFGAEKSPYETYVQSRTSPDKERVLLRIDKYIELHP